MDLIIELDHYCEHCNEPLETSKESSGSVYVSRCVKCSPTRDDILFWLSEFVDGVRQGEAEYKKDNEADIDLPNNVIIDHLMYLDDLRDSGLTNMFGAVPYLEKEFKISRGRALLILDYWMKTYSQRKEVIND